MVKIALITALLTLPALAWPTLADESVGRPTEIDGEEEAAPENTNDDSITWVDTSHAYATDQAQALTEWMDDFFGDPTYELEKAESLVRVQWRSSWDEQDNYDTKLRLRGKLQLPKISKRLNLVFDGEDGQDVITDERIQESSAGLQFNVEERQRSRLDLTLNVSSSDFRPGVRFRYKSAIGENYHYRFTQRIQWESDEGVFARTDLYFDRALSDTRLVRWSNRLIYGEETLGAEWLSVLSHSERRLTRGHDQSVLTYFASIDGYTDPDRTETFRIGTQLRRQFYRRYLFVELEPSYNWRKRLDDDNRNGVWNFVLRFEMLLERDLRHRGARSTP